MSPVRELISPFQFEKGVSLGSQRQQDRAKTQRLPWQKNCSLPAAIRPTLHVRMRCHSHTHTHTCPPCPLERW